MCITQRLSSFGYKNIKTSSDRVRRRALTKAVHACGWKSVHARLLCLYHDNVKKRIGRIFKRDAEFVLLTHSDACEVVDLADVRYPVPPNLHPRTRARILDNAVTHHHPYAIYKALRTAYESHRNDAFAYKLYDDMLYVERTDAFMKAMDMELPRTSAREDIQQNNCSGPWLLAFSIVFLLLGGAWVMV